MSDEIHNLSTDCDVRARARAWIAKFNSDDGVMRSAHKRHVALSEVVRKPKPFHSPAIGRWGSHFIRSKGEDCHIGDAFPVNNENRYGDAEYMRMVVPWEQSLNFCEEIEPLRFETVPVFIFKKVCCQIMWCGSLNTEFFWERIE